MKKRLSACIVSMTVTALSVTAVSAEPAVTQSVDKRPASGVPAQRTQLAEKSKRRSLHQFRDKSGSVTFTNRPEKYNYRDDFVEVKIKYERIPLPPTYKPTPVAAPKVVTDTTIKEVVKNYATLYRLDESLVYAVIQAESGFNPNAVSSAGARGLMQLMPGTAAEMGVVDIFDPTQNIAGGTQYLSKMLELFKDKRLAIAAYNAGPENVKKHNGIPPFEETQNYVRIVTAYETAYRKGGYVPNVAIADNKQFHFRRPATAAPAKSAYLVVFHSGLTQPADAVRDKDPYWFIEYANRSYPVRKDLVKSVQKPA